MVYCGSGLFQVAFSSVAVFSALYSRVFLKTYISSVQWLGITIVTVGLVISPLSSNTTGASPVTGILLTLLGAQFYAVSYIVNEFISVRLFVASNRSAFPETRDRRRFASASESSTQSSAVWLSALTRVVSIGVFHVVPNRNTLIYEPIAQKNATLTVDVGFGCKE